MQELLDTARTLISILAPTQSDTKRAASTVYYAIWHHLCRHVASCLVSDDTSLERARRQAYRSLDHNPVKSACVQTRDPKYGFPRAIVDDADVFVALQQRRHDADYDPDEHFTVTAVQDLIDACQAAITAFDACADKHKRSFVVFVALPKRR